MIQLLLLLGISLPAGPMQAARLKAQLTERDVTVFRAVIRAGLIPDPDITEPVFGSASLPPPVVSQTLRICKQLDGELGCVPVPPQMWTRPNAFTDAELEELTKVNAIARTVPPNLIVTVPFDRVFHGARTWGDLRTWVDHSKIPAFVQFTAPAYIDGMAVVYVQRVCDWPRTCGWFVRLKADGTQWRVVTKKLVWLSHPMA
jgi:hypothetical protein